MQQVWKISFGLMLLLITVACNANSDAVSVLQTNNTSLQATIASYASLGPTMTAQSAAQTAKMATMQSDLATARSQVKDLTAQLNASVGQSPNTGSSDISTGALDSATPVPPGPGTQQPNGFAFAGVVTAKGADNYGCAMNETTSFSVSDSRIYVIADVRNFKTGTNFTAKWSGDNFSRDDSWKATSSGSQICIYFYIEPKTLGLKAGDYSVTMTATGLSSPPVDFKLQGAG